MTRNEHVPSIEFSCLGTIVICCGRPSFSSTITCVKRGRAAQPQFTERAVPRSEGMTTCRPSPRAPSLAMNTRVRTPNRLEKYRSLLRIQYFLPETSYDCPFCATQIATNSYSTQTTTWAFPPTQYITTTYQQALPVAAINMATTVYVKNVGSQTDDKEIKDFFSFW